MVLPTGMFIFLAVLINCAAFATPDVGISSLDTDVQGFLQHHDSRHIFYNSILYNHYYASPAIKKTAIVFLPGMGEPAIKYYDITTDLQKEATYYLWDHIGQGTSFHFIPLERQKVHIDSFQTYTNTLIHFLEEIRKKHKTIIVIAHSMGGHIALRASLERPELIDKLVLSAPLIAINSTWVPVHFISWLAHFVPGDYYPPFYFLFKKNSERGNYTTNSKEKLATYKKTYTLFPEIKRSGATLSWIRSAQISIQELHDISFADYKTPLLLIQAEEDYLVSNPAQTELCARISTCRLKQISKSRHEILFEIKEHRDTAIDYIREFIDK